MPSIAALIIVELLALIYLAILTVERQGVIPAVRQRIEQLEDRLLASELDAAQNPVREDSVYLANRLDEIRQIPALQYVDVMTVFLELERVIPKDVALLSMIHRQTRGETVLTAASREPDSLMKFLLALEETSIWHDVRLVTQSTVSTRDGDQVKFEIRLKDRGI